MALAIRMIAARAGRSLTTLAIQMTVYRTNKGIEGTSAGKQAANFTLRVSMARNPFLLLFL